jgi:hypothetical protein
MTKRTTRAARAARAAKRAAHAAAKRAALAAATAVLLSVPAGAEPKADGTTVEPPPAAPAPSASSQETDLQARLDELAEARRAALDAERELQAANAALARANRRGARGERLARLEERQRQAQESFDATRRRVPELVARARAAGLSDAAARRWEHTLYGD